MKRSPFLILTMIILSDEINGFIFQLILDYVRQFVVLCWTNPELRKNSTDSVIVPTPGAWFKSRPIIYEMMSF